MRIKLVSLFLFIFFVNFAWAQVEGNGLASEHSNNEQIYSGKFTYFIGPGDELDVKVWRHPDLGNKLIVRPDGGISLLLIGDMPANGLTVSQLEGQITTGLGKIINNPKVNVNVTGFYSKKIFVLGEVNRPGVYPFEGEMGVVEAMSRAAGYKPNSAALRSVMVVRRIYSAKPDVLRVNAYDIIQKGAFKNEVSLYPGDIIFVPKTFISDVSDFVNQFLAQTDPALQYYLDIYNIKNPGVLNR